MNTPDNDVPEKNVLEAVAKLVPEARQAEYYRLMNHFRNLPPDDEFLQIVQATGFLTLLTQQVPAAVAAEREKLTQLLTKDGPEAIAKERAEFADILASSASQIQDAATKTSQYHGQLESRLTKLPDAIAKGIAPEAIASRIGESLRQHLTATGLETTVHTLDVMAKNMEKASVMLGHAFKNIADHQDGVLPKMATVVAAMENNLRCATNNVENVSQRLYKQAATWWVWVVAGAFFVVSVLVLLLLIVLPSKAHLGSIHVDPATLVQLPASALKLMPTLKDRERQIEQLQGQLKELQGQVRNTDELQRQLQDANDRIANMLPCNTGYHPRTR